MSDYVQPIGEADPNASYKDRNTGAGEPGSRVPALAIEMPQREILTVITSAGIPPNRTDPTQLNAAIDAKIALAIGSGESPLDDLLTLLRSKMLVYPEILTSDGKIPCFSPSTGTVRVPLGYTFRHRGVFDVTTLQQDFATVANKIYHLIWDPTNGLQQKDLADSGYNPTAAAETSQIFESTYDRMLICRVVTDASNVATITNLVNRDRLARSNRRTGTPGALGAGTLSFTSTETYDWARTPTVPVITGSVQADAAPAAAMDHIAGWVDNVVVTRYSATARVRTDWQSSASFTSSAAYLDFNLMA